MAPKNPHDLLKQFQRQIGYLERSAELYDRGDTDEAIRIAVTIRVLLHDTRNSTSLLQLAQKKDIRLMTSTHWLPPGAFEEVHLAMGTGPMGKQSFCGLTYPKQDEDGDIRLHASLGTLEHCELVPAQLWWEQAVIFSGNDDIVVTRKDIVLAAANKDGGAHVDTKLPPKYRVLFEGPTGRVKSGLSASYSSTRYPTVEDYVWREYDRREAHFCCLRQMAYELLLSAELMKLAGREIDRTHEPVIWPNDLVDWFLSEESAAED